MEPQCLCTEPESVRRLPLARGVLQRPHDVGVLAVSPFRNDFDIARALREIAFYQKHTGVMNAWWSWSQSWSQSRNGGL